MKISEAIPILNREQTLERTPKGRSISEYAIETLSSTISDQKNYHMDVIGCLGCGFVISSLLVSDGCPNCGAIDLTENIENIVEI